MRGGQNIRFQYDVICVWPYREIISFSCRDITRGIKLSGKGKKRGGGNLIVYSCKEIIIRGVKLQGGSFILNILAKILLMVVVDIYSRG